MFSNPYKSLVLATKLFSPLFYQLYFELIISSLFILFILFCLDLYTAPL